MGRGDERRFGEKNLPGSGTAVEVVSGKGNWAETAAAVRRRRKNKVEIGDGLDVSSMASEEEIIGEEDCGMPLNEIWCNKIVKKMVSQFLTF